MDVVGGLDIFRALFGGSCILLSLSEEVSGWLFGRDIHTICYSGEGGYLPTPPRNGEVGLLSILR